MNRRKKALVTGSSRGIGKAIALKLAESGFDCVINCKENEDEAKKVVEDIRNMGRQAFYVKADVGNYEEVEYMFHEIKRQFKGVDVLVNNAGIAKSQLIQDISVKDWKDIMQTNLDGTFYCSKMALEYMLNKKSGHIINISSVWGISGAALEIPYSASKGGIIAFTKALAKEVGFSGIRVNCIAPGGVDTDMLSPLRKEVIEEVVDMTPLGRLGRPQEIGELVRFLVDDKCTFITGQIISPNGGLVI